MRTELVEIYSDASNQSILRHPERKFSGVLIQGDTLSILHGEVCSALESAGDAMNEDARLELTHVRDFLASCLENYKTALSNHGMKLPFSD